MRVIHHFLLKIPALIALAAGLHCQSWQILALAYALLFGAYSLLWTVRMEDVVILDKRRS